MAGTTSTQKEKLIGFQATEPGAALPTHGTEFRLPPDEWDRFCQRLDAPPKVIPALQKLFSEPGPF